MGKKLSIVVPCYNEEEALPVFYAAILPVMGELQACGEIGDFELIFVDDGSRDGTLNQLKLLAQKDCHVKYFSFSRNFGKEAALLCGLRESSGDYVVTMDVDLQDPPGLIPEMLRGVTQEGFDCAGTRRVTRKGEPPVRSFFARQFYRIMRSLTDIEVVDGARDFRLMSRPMVNAIISMPERIRFSKGIFPWVGFKTRWFEYENIERSAGSTKWSFWSLFLYSIDGITAFSSKPTGSGQLPGHTLLVPGILSGHIHHHQKIGVRRSHRRLAVSGVHHFDCRWTSVVLHRGFRAISC